MIRILLLSALIFTTMACGRDTDIAPTLAGEVAGHYQTNGFLDFRCIALPAGSMPAATLRSQSDAAVTITYVETYPTASVQTITGVLLQRQADNSIQLSSNGVVIGSVRTDRVFSSNGMERQGLVLRLQAGSSAPSATALTFTGSKE